MPSAEKHTAPENKNIAAKLLQVMKACGYIQKDSENKEQRYRYVSAAAVLEKVNAALVESRMISVPEFSVVSEREKPTSKGGLWQLVTVQCRLQVIDADSGEFLVITSLGTGADPGDKAAAKAQTMALKYAWLTALNIETGDEPEADDRTDKQEFITQPVTAPPSFAPASFVPAGLPNNSRTQAICQLWQAIGWDSNTLPGYLENRFKKPVGEINDAELAVVSQEASFYYNQRRY